jgi:hypothetical protein
MAGYLGKAYALAQIDGYTTEQANTRFCRYYEQAEEPTEAVSGDIWKDTDTGVAALLYVEGENRVWMEI